MHEKDFEFLVEEGFSIPGMDEKGILVKGNDTKLIQQIKFLWPSWMNVMNNLHILHECKSDEHVFY